MAAARFSRKPANDLDDPARGRQIEHRDAIQIVRGDERGPQRSTVRPRVLRAVKCSLNIRPLDTIVDHVDLVLQVGPVKALEELRDNDRGIRCVGHFVIDQVADAIHSSNTGFAQPLYRPHHGPAVDLLKYDDIGPGVDRICDQ
jgi:hypothetical protein